MRHRSLIASLLSLALLTAFSGCSTLTAPAAYKAANKSRLAAVEPWLTDYAKTQPPATTQKVDDVLTSWHVEVNSQQQVK